MAAKSPSGLHPTTGRTTSEPLHAVEPVVEAEESTREGEDWRLTEMTLASQRIERSVDGVRRDIRVWVRAEIENLYHLTDIRMTRLEERIERMHEDLTRQLTAVLVGRSGS